jgi:hypothetical protein
MWRQQPDVMQNLFGDFKLEMNVAYHPVALALEHAGRVP